MLHERRHAPEMRIPPSVRRAREPDPVAKDANNLDRPDLANVTERASYTTFHQLGSSITDQCKDRLDR
jgi:hypothetical protein